MITIKSLYSRRRLVTITLLCVFAATVVLNLLFNIDRYYPDEEGCDLFYCISNDNDEPMRDISLTGETVEQTLYITDRFNVLYLYVEKNEAEDVDENAQFLLEINDPKGNLIWSKQGKAFDVFNGLKTEENYLNADRNAGLFTIKVTPLSIGKASPWLLSTASAKNYDNYIKDSTLKIGGKTVNGRLLSLAVGDHNMIKCLLPYNLFLFLALPLIELVVLFAWLIYCRKSRKKQTV